MDIFMKIIPKICSLLFSPKLNTPSTTHPAPSSSIFMMSGVKMSINILHHFNIRPNIEHRAGQTAVRLQSQKRVVAIFLNPQNDYLMTKNR